MRMMKSNSTFLPLFSKGSTYLTSGFFCNSLYRSIQTLVSNSILSKGISEIVSKCLGEYTTTSHSPFDGLVEIFSKYIFSPFELKLAHRFGKTATSKFLKGISVG